MNEFIAFVGRQCDTYGISLMLVPNDHVTIGDTKCNGFFDDERKMLAVATGKDEDTWHATLVHEYGHMTQWMDQCDEWKALYIDDRITVEYLIDLWLAHKIELTSQQLDDYISRSRGVEVDCEHRSVALIEDHGLTLDVTDYCKKANAYMYFWTAIKQFREWYIIGREPYTLKAVVDAMPDKLKTNAEYDDIPREFVELLKGCVNGS